MKLFKLTVLPVPFIKWSPSLIRLPANFHFRPKNIKILFFIYHSKVAALVDLPYFNKYLRAQWCFSGHFVFLQYLLMDDDTNLTTLILPKKDKVWNFSVSYSSGYFSGYIYIWIYFPVLNRIFLIPYLKFTFENIIKISFNVFNHKPAKKMEVSLIMVN